MKKSTIILVVVFVLAILLQVIDARPGKLGLTVLGATTPVLVPALAVVGKL